MPEVKDFLYRVQISLSTTNVFLNYDVVQIQISTILQNIGHPPMTRSMRRNFVVI